MGNKFFDLTVFCDGSMPTFTVEEETLKDFEESFKKKETISFKNKGAGGETGGQVVLRNNKLVGYQKSAVPESLGNVLNKTEQG